ncbi:hypothetical protein [Tabrizicola sp.]|uniref:hypothetical protein n=1 Tax=Tabrizicola sp. TaxID=2005166 RepID=UPI003F2AF87A
MIRLLAITLALGLAPAAQAQELSPEEFQARTEGRAFGTYFADGTLLGIEIFLSDRQVIWQTIDGLCQKGIWQVQNGYVCYLYEQVNPGHCMIYRAEGDVIIGRTDYGEDFTLRQGSKDDVTCPTDEPLLSLDGDVGQYLPARLEASPISAE